MISGFVGGVFPFTIVVTSVENFVYLILDEPSEWV